MIYNKSKHKIPKNAIYIGRGSKWGNPYHIGKDGTREEVIEKYKWYLIKQIKNGNVTIEELADMYDVDMVCFCKPLPCHGDVIQDFAKVAARKLGYFGE